MEQSEKDDKGKYFKYQFDISTASQLYGDNSMEHGSKIVTLFAEVYASLVKLYGTDVTKDSMLRFENSERFKKWFWYIKHQLGTVILRDPQFDDIGLWLGKGLFLKIILSTIDFNQLELPNLDLEYLIRRQKRLIEAFCKECDHDFMRKGCMSTSETGYTILGENVCTSNCSDIMKINLI